MKTSMLGNFLKVTSGLAQIAVTCIKLVVEAFLESCRICVCNVLLWTPSYLRSEIRPNNLLSYPWLLEHMNMGDESLRWLRLLNMVAQMCVVNP